MATSVFKVHYLYFSIHTFRSFTASPMSLHGKSSRGTAFQISFLSLSGYGTFSFSSSTHPNSSLPDPSPLSTPPDLHNRTPHQLSLYVARLPFSNNSIFQPWSSKESSLAQMSTGQSSWFSPDFCKNANSCTVDEHPSSAQLEVAPAPVIGCQFSFRNTFNSVKSSLTTPVPSQGGINVIWLVQPDWMSDGPADEFKARLPFPNNSIFQPRSWKASSLAQMFSGQRSWFSPDFCKNVNSCMAAEHPSSAQLEVAPAPVLAFQFSFRNTFNSVKRLTAPVPSQGAIKVIWLVQPDSMSDGPADEIKASRCSLIFSSIVGPASWHKSKTNIKWIVLEAFTFFKPRSNR